MQSHSCCDQHHDLMVTFVEVHVRMRQVNTESVTSDGSALVRPEKFSIVVTGHSQNNPLGQPNTR